MNSEKMKLRNREEMRKTHLECGWACSGEVKGIPLCLVQISTVL